MNINTIDMLNAYKKRLENMQSRMLIVTDILKVNRKMHVRICWTAKHLTGRKIQADRSDFG